jgi:hypothetical protein
LTPFRAEVPERHFDVRAVQFAGQRGGFQRRDVPAGAAKERSAEDPVAALTPTGVAKSRE